jgi:hypothetical protein
VTLEDRAFLGNLSLDGDGFPTNVELYDAVD